jgi:hypothetical protein
MMRPGTFRRAATALLVAACTHSEPYATDGPDPLGPADPGLPRQLTYNPGDDRAPSVAGSQVVFSRRDPLQPSPGLCIALLPAEGGTLSATLCPPPPSVADTFVSSWLEPALAPDGTRLAYVWRRSPQVSALAAWSYHLVVAAVDAPAVPVVSASIARLLPGDRRVNTALEPAWVTPDVIRFLAAFDSIFKVKGGGANRFTDTVTAPRALMDFTISTGAFAIVPGGDGVVAWHPLGPDRMLIVPDSSPRSLLYLDADGTRTPAHVWPVPVTDITTRGSTVAATAGLDTLYWVDFESGPGQSPLPGQAWRLSSATSGVVVEVERQGGDGFGAPANLWLVSVPTVLPPH